MNSWFTLPAELNNWLRNYFLSKFGRLGSVRLFYIFKKPQDAWKRLLLLTPCDIVTTSL